MSYKNLRYVGTESASLIVRGLDNQVTAADASDDGVCDYRNFALPRIPASVSTPMLEHAYAAPILVTVSYLVLWYYLLLLGQSRTKYRLKAQYEREGKVFDRYFGQDPEMLAADRAVANTLEQMGPFLVSLWMFAVFVSPEQAGWYGGAYVLLRAVYPLLLGKRVTNTQSKRVAFVTFPAYLIVFAMLGRTVAAAL